MRYGNGSSKQTVKTVVEASNLHPVRCVFFSTASAARLPGWLASTAFVRRFVLLGCHCPLACHFKFERQHVAYNIATCFLMDRALFELLSLRRGCLWFLISNFRSVALGPGSNASRCLARCGVLPLMVGRNYTGSF